MFNELMRVSIEDKKIDRQCVTIAVEGPVCSGKSTLLEKIGNSTPSLIVPEYMVYPPIVDIPFPKLPPKTSKEAKENFLYFLEIEATRKAEHDKSRAEIRYLDRSIFTLLAFELGSYYSSGIDIFTWAFRKIVNAKDVIVPNQIIYLDVSKETALERAKIAGMNMPKFLFSNDFNSAFKSMFVALNAIKPGYVTFIDANQEKDYIHKQVQNLTCRLKITS